MAVRDCSAAPPHQASHGKVRISLGTVLKFPPSLQDFHAFIDDELSPDERARVVEWLMRHPNERRELQELKLRENLLRQAVRQSKIMRDKASNARTRKSDIDE